MLQLQFIQSESLEQSLVVEGQFATEEDMRSWGWSECFGFCGTMCAAFLAERSFGL